MHLKKHDYWIDFLLWLGVAVSGAVVIYALWQNEVNLSLTGLVLMGAFLFLLAYQKYMQLVRLRKKFVVFQEGFSALVLVWAAYRMFATKRSEKASEAIQDTREKLAKAYQKSRLHLSVDFLMKVMKTFAQMKALKHNLGHEMKTLVSDEGFNLETAERIGESFSELAQKAGQLVDTVGQGLGEEKKELASIDKAVARPATKRTKATKSSRSTKSA